MKNLILTIAFISLLSSLGFAQPERQKVVQGNQLYEEERYDEALNKYIDAQTQAPESPVIKFNIGDAQYKKTKYEEALKQFETTLTVDDANMQSRTYYNMGNTMYRMGKLTDSILMYKKALELNPDDEDAKYNLEFVRKQLKDQSDKQNQDQNQQQQQDQQQQQNQNNENQDQQDKEQQEQQQQQQQEQKQEQQQDQQQDQNEEEQQKEEQQQQQQQQQQAAEKMSKEDAEKILNALKEDEQDIKDARKVKAPAGMRVTKDW